MADEQDKNVGAGNGTENGQGAGQEPNYKALYEESLSKITKLSKDNDSLNKYNQDLKGKYQSTLDETQKAKIAQEEKEQQYKDMEKQLKSYKYKNELSKSISDSKVVDEIADMIVNGDTDGYISKINEYISSSKENYEKQLNEAKITKTQTPPASKGTGKTKEELLKMSMEDWNKLEKENPLQYKTLMGILKS